MRNRLVLFFLLTFAISWAIWVPQALAELGITEPVITLDSPLNLVAAWGPGLAAVLMTIFTAGESGWRDLFGPIGRWRVSILWYALVLLFPFAVWLAARGLDVLLGQTYALTSLLSELGPQYAGMLPLLLIFALPYSLGEELGWRGFALPRLQTRYNALVSSIILGLIWALWHVPTWIAQGQMGLSLLVSALPILSAAIIFTWVYNNTNSLLLVWLYHAAIAVKGYLLAPLPTLTDEIIGWVVAILIVVIAGPVRLSCSHEGKPE